MIRTFSVMLCVLVVGGVALTGCGSDSSSSTSSSTPATSTPATSTPASTTASDTSVASNPAVKQAVASCKQAIDSNPAVKANIKGDLEKICDKAANGDIKSAQEATKEVCLKIVDSSGIPDGAAKDQAESACKAAGGN